MNLEVRAAGLRTLRERRGMTQRELAQAIGISQNYVPALESGARCPGPRLRQQLLRFFGCDFEELFQVVMVNPEGSAERVFTPKVEREAG